MVEEENKNTILAMNGHFGDFVPPSPLGTDATSPDLLKQFLPYPNLKDIRLLTLRHVYTSPNRSENKYTIDDVTAIFGAVPQVCRVGVGHGVVWERASFSPGSKYANLDSPGIIRIGDLDCLSLKLSRAFSTLRRWFREIASRKGRNTRSMD
ncbi:hypothetical protein C0995_001630 [Termitomyces sp. Mi166|nr:hypothetical protein C0995_001630 [Termitomyces sp. Mi166\